MSLSSFPVNRQENSAGFSILEFKPYKKNTLLGFVMLQLPSGMVVHNCTLHAKNDSRWIGLPSREYAKPDGTKSWTPLIEFASAEAKNRFQAGAIQAVEQYLRNLPGGGL